MAGCPRRQRVGCSRASSYSANRSSSPGQSYADKKLRRAQFNCFDFGLSTAGRATSLPHTWQKLARWQRQCQEHIWLEVEGSGPWHFRSIQPDVRSHKSHHEWSKPHGSKCVCACVLANPCPAAPLCNHICADLCWLLKNAARQDHLRAAPLSAEAQSRNHPARKHAKRLSWRTWQLGLPVCTGSFENCV